MFADKYGIPKSGYIDRVHRPIIAGVIRTFTIVMASCLQDFDVQMRVAAAREVAHLGGRDTDT